MPTHKANANPFKRRTTRHRGVTYRERNDGSRTYSVYFQGRYVPVTGGEADALARQAELRGKMARGETVLLPGRVLFSEVAESYIESKHRLRPGTKRTYRATLDRILIPRFGDAKIGALTVDDVARLSRDLERQGLRPTTIHAYLMPLRGVMGYAVRRGFTSVNPCDQLTRDDRPQVVEQRPDHVWSDEEIEALVDAAEQLARKPESRYDYAPLIRTALYTGLRLGELLGLRWEDVDLQDAVLHVRRQWTRAAEYGPTKSRAGVRRIPLSADMKAYLAALKLRSDYSGDQDPVFVSRSGKPLGHRNVTRRGFEVAAELAGIEGVTFHSMRHAFASRMISRGIEPVALASLMGHEDARITLSRYAHVYDKRRTDDAVREAMAW
jgi:integrase